METLMNSVFRYRMLCYVFFLILIVSESFQLSSEKGVGKDCDCYSKCHNNFTNSAFAEQLKSACQTGCRFYSLVLHTSREVVINPSSINSHSMKGCQMSCHKSYENPTEVAACDFGCLSVNSPQSTASCNSAEHEIPQIMYSIYIEESDMLIHAGDPDLDDALIDPGLRKQFAKTLESLFDLKPKLPEIHFRNLPISNKEISIDRPRATFKCPKFYGFDTNLEFRNGKVITTAVFFLFSFLVFAFICFIVSRHLEKQRTLWKQVLSNIIQNKSLMKFKENLITDESLTKDDMLCKGIVTYSFNQPGEDASDDAKVVHIGDEYPYLKV